MALLDYSSHPKINKQLAESTILSRNPGELVVYQHLKLPTVKDRNFTLRVTWTDGAARGLRFTVDGRRGPGTLSRTGITISRR